MTKQVLLGTALLLPLAAVAADFQPLAMKPGLWEVTLESKIQFPDAMLANMPPQARAAMAGRGGQSTVVKSCMTKESMSRAFDFNNDPKKTCQYTIVSSTPTRQEVNVDCTTKSGKSTGKMVFEAISPEAGKGTVDLTMEMGAGTMKSTMVISSKYLGSDCGDVKPK